MHIVLFHVIAQIDMICMAWINFLRKRDNMKIAGNKVTHSIIWYVYGGMHSHYFVAHFPYVIKDAHPRNMLTAM